VVITENSAEQIKSVSANGVNVKQNMDGSRSLGPLGSIQLGTVNVSDPGNKISLSDTIDIRNGTATIIITNANVGFDSVRRRRSIHRMYCIISTTGWDEP
jgi:hypothetical protein